MIHEWQPDSLAMQRGILKKPRGHRKLLSKQCGKWGMAIAEEIQEKRHGVKETGQTEQTTTSSVSAGAIRKKGKVRS